MRTRCVAAQHGVRRAALWRRYAAHRMVDAIRGFLEDSSPTAIFVLALRALILNQHCDDNSLPFEIRGRRIHDNAELV
jgi:hypothetical protein